MKKEALFFVKTMLRLIKNQQKQSSLIKNQQQFS
jgi:hypothetical protein